MPTDVVSSTRVPSWNGALENQNQRQIAASLDEPFPSPTSRMGRLRDSSDSYAVRILLCEVANTVLDEGLRECLAEILPQSEIDQIYRFRFDADRRMALASRVLARHVIADEGGSDTDMLAIDIERSKKAGNRPIWKPSSPKDRFIHFNVSHDKDVVVLAASRQLVGIDVMRIATTKEDRPLRDFFDSLRGSFSALEWRYITQPAGERDQLERFMELWTMKEAYVKAIATGLYVEPLRLECVSECNGASTSSTSTPPQASFALGPMKVDGKPLASFCFRHLRQPDGYMICLAMGPHKAAHELYGSFIPNDVLTCPYDPPAALTDEQVWVEAVDLTDLINRYTIPGAF
ncbi:unnamed protein product [Vitrella brassicaformis CCMP3155]|uniref:holo-[acyl-carrier-protein] synthase n=2 Tax=Vitrella brassicaformis TaxID=1169539 RepID=A0A0G4G4Z2_VITBC|nr:unnamed protein product [Vitrella brassicaformis CCMP3155]|eukprot:CEM23170.1 unnamed protein product [Vitrella brassicaformis CCMP3155]